ncbi:MAG: iron-sulfur cluster assembly scaffold protein [Dehalococcoidales bacterium]|nr:iron-sulfur cluster assembly scaffold protein [Dehalococcoidales bacterium]
MTTEWDKYQELVKEQMSKHFTEPYIKHSMEPKNVGDMENANTYISVLGSCGDSMELWLKVKENRIIDAAFMTDGCGATIACGSILTEMAKNKTLGEALAISAKTLIEALGGLPEGHTHCAGLASLTLKKAVLEYMNMKKEPWKKVYTESEKRHNPIRVDETEEL